jgi:hypothetical protein
MHVTPAHAGVWWFLSGSPRNECGVTVHRHCERQRRNPAGAWIATSLALLAMTAEKAVIPAKAGIQRTGELDSSLRWNDRN